jgi:hypothetical protein
VRAAGHQARHDQQGAPRARHRAGLVGDLLVGETVRRRSSIQAASIVEQPLRVSPTTTT